MTVELLVTSGRGPAECRQAVGHVLQRMEEEAERIGLDLDIAVREAPHGPSSAVVVIHGPGADAFAGAWLGTILWTCPSTVRPGHRRKNWFIGVFQLERQNTSAKSVASADLRFETYRAGGPGGQHVNTTDSAVRVTHLPTGLSATARDGRSQIQNRKRAVERLSRLLVLRAKVLRVEDGRAENLLHDRLERGNPRRSFKGPHFREGR